MNTSSCFAAAMQVRPCARWIVVAVLLMAGLSPRVGRAQTADAGAAVADAAVTVEPASFAIGELATLDVSVSFPSAPQWVELDLAPLAPQFEVRRVVAGRAFGARRRWTIEVTSFEPGTQVVPALTINGARAEGPSGAMARTSPIAIRVTSPTVKAEDPLQPMIGVLDPPPWPVWVRVLLWLVAGVAAVTALSTLAIWSRRTAERRRRTRAFWTATTAEMRRLTNEARGASPEGRRTLLHSAAALIKTALGAAIEPRVRGRSSTDVHAILSEHSKHHPIRDHSASILSSLDRQRFGPKPVADPDPAVLPDAVTLVEGLPRRLRSDGER